MKSVQKEFQGRNLEDGSAKEEKKTFIKYDLVKSIYGNYKFRLNGQPDQKGIKVNFFRQKKNFFAYSEYTHGQSNF